MSLLRYFRVMVMIVLSLAMALPAAQAEAESETLREPVGPVFFSTVRGDAPSGKIPPVAGYQLIDLGTGERFEYPRHEGEEGSVDWNYPHYGKVSPDGRLVVQVNGILGDFDSERREHFSVVTILSGEVETTVARVPRNGGDISWLSNEELLVSHYDLDKTFRVPINGDDIEEFFDGAAPTLTVSPDGRYIWDGEHLRDDSGEILHTDLPQLSAASWSADSSKLVWTVAGGAAVVGQPDERSIRVLDVASLTSREVFLADDSARVATAKFHPDGEHIYFMHHLGDGEVDEQTMRLERLSLLDCCQPEVVWTSPRTTPRLRALSSVSPDGNFVSVYDWSCAGDKCRGGILDLDTFELVESEQNLFSEFLPRRTPAPEPDPCAGEFGTASFSDRSSIPIVHRHNVDCTHGLQIVTGFADGTFGPQHSVRRDQMASFIARALRVSGAELPTANRARFDDVRADSVHANSINDLAEADIVLGSSSDTYSPGQKVRRDQMASFLIRPAEYGREGQMGSQAQAFPDVPPSNSHYPSVNGASQAGLASGFPDGTYKPSSGVRRDQMATFVNRLYNLLPTRTQ